MSCEYIQDLAQSIWIDIGEPTSMTVTAVAAQLTSEFYLGKLNNLIGQCYSGDGSGCITPVLTNTEQGILGEMFKVNYYGRLVTRAAGAGGTERQLIALDEADTRIRWVNSSEIAKTYVQLQKDAQANLDMLIRSYFDLSKGADVPRDISFYN